MDAGVRAMHGAIAETTTPKGRRTAVTPLEPLRRPAQRKLNLEFLQNAKPDERESSLRQRLLSCG